ncbi:hypothetical protein PTKIN_Ptkin18bG0138600 [Pterospermum kingtungense]
MDRSTRETNVYFGNETYDFDTIETHRNLYGTLYYLTRAVNDSNHMHATDKVNVPSIMTLDGLVQSTPDLSVEDCRSYLRSAIDELQPFSRGVKGARVLYPSCNIRYNIYRSNEKPGVESEAPLPSANKSGTDGDAKWVPIVASLSGIFGLGLFCSGGVFLWRRRNSEEYANANEIFQGESGVRSKEFPSIQLDILLAATNHFSDENKLGQGGFGPVYKGKLPDDKEIAVKRLSRTSGQGLVEFKNEVMLIAKLQHRNLVRLLGCCLDQNEKLLVYEYMPNKSLDVFLFDSSHGVQLDWQKRLSIINGIA